MQASTQLPYGMMAVPASHQRYAPSLLQADAGSGPGAGQHRGRAGRPRKSLPLERAAAAGGFGNRVLPLCCNCCLRIVLPLRCPGAGMVLPTW